MPTISKLSKLFQAVSSKDFASAEVVALEMVSDEEQKGHHSAAQFLKGSLRTNGHRNNGITMNPMSNNASQILSNALSSIKPTIPLASVKLTPQVSESLNEIIKEVKHHSLLTKKGLKARRKLLFYGPPGCGKSLSAHALAKELGIPLYVVRFDAVIGAYLGQTAVHLRELFIFAEATNCVMLFDEIDALGKHRGRQSEVGELDRIVIALMQELELSNPRGLIIATSNLPEGLDRALWRRFDLSVGFPAPTKAGVTSYAREKAKQYNLRFSDSLAKAVQKCTSYASAETLVQNEARRKLLGKL